MIQIFITTIVFPMNWTTTIRIVTTMSVVGQSYTNQLDQCFFNSREQRLSNSRDPCLWVKKIKRGEVRLKNILNSKEYLYMRLFTV